MYGGVGGAGPRGFPLSRFRLATRPCNAPLATTVWPSQASLGAACCSVNETQAVLGDILAEPGLNGLPVADWNIAAASPPQGAIAAVSRRGTTVSRRPHTGRTNRRPILGMPGKVPTSLQHSGGAWSEETDQIKRKAISSRRRDGTLRPPLRAGRKRHCCTASTALSSRPRPR